MISVVYTKVFEKEYYSLTKKNKKLGQKIKKKLEFFLNNPYHSSLKAHKVYSPKVGEVFSFAVSGDLRILFRWKTGNAVIFYRIGSHKEVY